jgi:ribose-phosphate pyrophosphokinase
MTRGLAVHAFLPDMPAASRLAAALGCECHAIALHRFPDGESLVRVAQTPDRPILYAALGNPNGKLFNLLLASEALGAPVLVAPYLPYLRQDIAFHPGEAVSQKVIGRLFAQAFDLIVAVEPHLHRTPTLDAVFPGTRTICLSGGSVLAQLLPMDAPSPLLVGPDIESGALVGAMKVASGMEAVSLRKKRTGDRKVRIEIPEGLEVNGRKVFLVDDVCSTGETLTEAARLLRERGASSVEALVVHAIFDQAAEHRLRRAGIERVRSTDSLPHPSNAVSLAPLLATALKEALP